MQNKNIPMAEFPLMEKNDGIPLFWPYIPKNAIDEVSSTLSSRWIGQGPKVDLFEKSIERLFLASSRALAVGSGTDALHLAYLLADIRRGDEVIVPIFTCTATNIPLLYLGAKIIFADVNPNTLGIDLEHVERLVTNKTKAIVTVDYGGYPVDFDRLKLIANKYSLKIISDAAHSFASKYKSVYACDIADFTIFSFQAIKTITTGDGGMLIIKDSDLYEKAKRLRWFGIDRTAKQKGIWENDVKEIGYKYQMNDISASIGLACLKDLENIVQHRRKLFQLYFEGLNDCQPVKVLPGEYKLHDFCPWLMTIIIDDRISLMSSLRNKGIESAQVHYRNDRYSIFGGRRNSCPNMDYIEDKYLVLPLHMNMTEVDVLKIVKAIKEHYQ